MAWPKQLPEPYVVSIVLACQLVMHGTGQCSGVQRLAYARNQLRA